MTSNRLYLSASNVVASDGTVTCSFNPPPMGSVYTGSLTGSQANGTWTVDISLQPWGTFFGLAPYGPVQAYGGESIIIKGTGLTPGTTVTITFIGTISDEQSTEPVAPTALVTSVSIGNTVEVAGGLNVTNSVLNVDGSVIAIPNEYAFVSQIVYDLTAAQTFLCYLPANGSNVSSLLIANTATKAITIRVTGINTGIAYSSGGTGNPIYLPANDYISIPYSAVLDPAGVQIIVNVQGSSNNNNNLGDLRIIGRSDTAEVVATNSHGSSEPTNFAAGTADARTGNVTTNLLTGTGSTVVRIWSIQLAGWAQSGGGGVASLADGTVAYLTLPILGATSNSADITFPGGLAIPLKSGSLYINAFNTLYVAGGFSYSIDSQ